MKIPVPSQLPTPRNLSSLGDNCSFQLHPESGLPVNVAIGTLDTDIWQVKMKDIPDIHYYHNLSLLFHNLDNTQLSGSEIHHLLEGDAEVESPGSSLKSTCNAITTSTQDSECQHCDTVNSFMVGCKSSNLAPKDISFISSQCNDAHQISFLEQPTFYDFCDTELKQLQYDSCYTIDEFVQPYVNEIYDLETNIHDKNEVHGNGLPDESCNYIWDPGMENVIVSTSIPFGFEDTDSQNCIGLDPEKLFIACETEQLSDTAITNFYSALDEHSPTSRCARSPSNSSEDIVGSCLTQAKYENDVLEAADIPTKSNAKSMLESNILTCSLDGSPLKTGSFLALDEKHCVEMKYEDCKTKRLSHTEKRKPKAIDTQKPRPRDRQLIQDRVKELRELVPNGNKCSIDALLDRTVRHMTFLRSVSSQAEKLKYAQSRRRVWNEDDLDSFARQVPQNNATWAYEVGGHSGQQSESCPIIVENIDQQGHILVEMLCIEYGDFLEIAQVLRRLNLTILKGIMESRDGDLWAHFVVEGSRGFNRMEILWHLMQLLQQNRISIPSKLW